MPHPGAPALLLRVGDHERLTASVRSGSVRAALAQRARIVLLAAEGMLNTEIAERVGVSRPTVNRWRARYPTAGIDGLVDEDRPGRPRDGRPASNRDRDVDPAAGTAGGDALVAPAAGRAS